ncbi:hypothetical protein QTP88_003651 [Uroleucon formosanum]
MWVQQQQIVEVKSSEDGSRKRKIFPIILSKCKDGPLFKKRKIGDPFTEYMKSQRKRKIFTITLSKCKNEPLIKKRKTGHPFTEYLKSPRKRKIFTITLSKCNNEPLIKKRKTGHPFTENLKSPLEGTFLRTFLPDMDEQPLEKIRKIQDQPNSNPTVNRKRKIFTITLSKCKNEPLFKKRKIGDPFTEYLKSQLEGTFLRTFLPDMNKQLLEKIRKIQDQPNSNHTVNCERKVFTIIQSNCKNEPLFKTWKTGYPFTEYLKSQLEETFLRTFLPDMDKLDWKTGLEKIRKIQDQPNSNHTVNCERKVFTIIQSNCKNEPLFKKWKTGYPFTEYLISQLKGTFLLTFLPDMDEQPLEKIRKIQDQPNSNPTVNCERKVFTIIQSNCMNEPLFKTWKTGYPFTEYLKSQLKGTFLLTFLPDMDEQPLQKIRKIQDQPNSNPTVNRKRKIFTITLSKCKNEPLFKKRKIRDPFTEYLISQLKGTFLRTFLPDMDEQPLEKIRKIYDKPNSNSIFNHKHHFQILPNIVSDIYAPAIRIRKMNDQFIFNSKVKPEIPIVKSIAEQCASIFQGPMKYWVLDLAGASMSLVHMKRL